MEISKRKVASDKLTKYDIFAKEEDFIEVTEWTNGEGIDITIESNHKSKIFSLSFGELDAINYLKSSIDYDR